MAPIEPLENGNKYASVLKHLVAVVYIFSPLAYWGYQISHGQEPTMLIWVLVLGFSIASAYVIFGRKQVSAALDEARGITEQEDSSDE